jgi:ArsR family transcriptional regulator
MKALGEKNRLRAFLALLDTEELCVCDVGEFLELAPATVSRHMSLLCQAGLVDFQKRGRWVYYRISPKVDPGLLQWIRNAVEDSPSRPEDRKKVGEIVRFHREFGSCSSEKGKNP